MIGSELLTILNVLFFILVENIKHPKRVSMKTSKTVLVVFIIVVSSSIVSAAFYGTFPNVLFYLAYLILLVITYKNVNIEVEARELLQIIHSFILIETVVTFFIIFKTKSIVPGDAFGGSLLNAHFFANWIILTAFACFYFVRKSHNKTIKEIPWMMVLVILLILASANAVLVAAIIAGIIQFFFLLNKKENNNTIFLDDCYNLCCFCYFFADFIFYTSKSVYFRKKTISSLIFILRRMEL